jgi:hypothetical protein
MIRRLLIAIACLSAMHGYAQIITRFELDMTRPMQDIAEPADLCLDAITSLPDSSLRLVRVVGPGKTIDVPFQVQQGVHRMLYWMVEPSSPGWISYQLVKITPDQQRPNWPRITASPQDGELRIRFNDQPLLQYVYKTVYPPPGVDTAYKRSGFIHPLWTPHGQVLTRIQPPDHYHHYGIWDPWTHVLFKGDTVDFWNLKDRKGTVRFSEFAGLVDGPVFAEYTAVQNHIAFKKTGGEDTALVELQDLRVYHPHPDYYIFDLTIILSCASEYPVRLLTYRYGGVGWRATSEWNKDNSEVLTSEGKGRKDADGSKARWCIVQGALGAEYGGAVMLSSPENFNFPEPLRIWPENANGRGDMYANFSPTKDRDWQLDPGHKYALNYRWAVFNGHFTREKAESVWQYFAKAPAISFK